MNISDFQIGDIIIFPEKPQERITKSPGWVSMMDNYAGLVVTIIAISTTDNPYDAPHVRVKTPDNRTWNLQPQWIKPKPLEVGDTFIFPDPPEDWFEYPCWAGPMSKLSGTLCIVHSTSSRDPDIIYSNEWALKRSWIKGHHSTNPVSKLDKVCRKIKQLDQRWKENQIKKGNKVCV